MKILLLGEFSGLHKNLKDGLVELGHDVTISATGDGWKRIPCDIDLSVSGNGLVAKVKRRLFYFKYLLSVRNFDVVQIVNADLLSLSLFPNKFMLDYLVKNNGKVYLLGAGDDAYFWMYGRAALKYGPFDDCLKYDLGTKRSRFETKKKLELNGYIANQVSGVIPIMYEYAVAYKDMDNLLPIVPIPINTDEIVCEKSDSGGGFVVFHGLNRPGFKGTHYIESAFGILQKKYPEVEFVIKGKMRLNEYLQLMSRATVIIDQVNSHSLGVNGLLAMAMGKVVLGGVEQESLDAFGIERSPAINVRPDVNDIVDKVSRVIELGPEKINALGRESRMFVEKNHNYELVAKKYIEVWNC